MELSVIIPHIEALIFASEKPLTDVEMTELVNSALGFIEDRATIEQVQAAIEGIGEKYNSEFYAFELKQIGGGWQFLTKKEYHKTVAQLNGDKFLKRLSTAALETLAIIAYKQPITKSEVESIRGVNCDYAVQKLLEKDLVIISGRNEDAVGKPLIYSTSKSFMDYFGINSAADLPKISEVLMEELVQATNVQDAEQEQTDHEASEAGTGIAEDDKGLIVTPEGDLLEEDATEAGTDAAINEVPDEAEAGQGEIVTDAPANEETAEEDGEDENEEKDNKDDQQV
jgi:segregation and condensation protein B